VTVNSSVAVNDSGAFEVNVTKRDATATMLSDATQNVGVGESFWVNASCMDEYDNDFSGDADLLEDGNWKDTKTGVTKYANFSWSESVEGTYNYTVVFYNMTYYNNGTTGYSNVTVLSPFPVLNVGIISDVPNVNRDTDLSLNASVNNTGNANATNTYLNWTLPSDWNVTSGDQNKSIGTLEPSQMGYNNITVHINISASLGPQTILLEGNCTEGVYDNDSMAITVWATTAINESIANDTNPVQGESILLSARLIWDNTSTISGQSLSFYYNETYITSGFTNDTGWAEVTWNTTSVSPGSYYINVTYSDNTSIYTRASYNDTLNITINPDTEKPDWYDQDQSVSSLHKGESIELSTRWTDVGLGLKNVTLATNGTGSWQSVSTISLSGKEDWSNFTLDTELMDWIPGTIGWNVTAYDAAGNDNTTDIMTFELWGWSNITWISPQKKGYSTGTIIELTCQVRDANSSDTVEGYPVKFWWYNDTTTVYLNESLTNSSGYASLSWNTSGLPDGTYYPKANITDNATLYYNTSADWECNTSITLGTFGVIVWPDSSAKTATNVNASYTIYITNNGTVNDTYNLTVINIHAADIAVLSQNTITVVAGGTGSVTLYVTDSQSGTYRVNVTATSQLNSSVTDEITTVTTVAAAEPTPPPGGGGAPPRPPPRVGLSVPKLPVLNEIGPGQISTMNITIRNPNADSVSVEIRIDGIPSHWVDVKPKTFSMSPYTSQESNIILTVPPDAQPGEYVVNVIISSDAGTTVESFVLRVIAYSLNPDEPRATRILEVNRYKGTTLVTIRVENARRFAQRIEVTEEIPKSIANTIEEIRFDTPPTEILSYDPVVKWVLEDVAAYETHLITYEVSKVIESDSPDIYWSVNKVNIYYVQGEPYVEPIEIQKLSTSSTYAGEPAKVSAEIRNKGNRALDVTIVLDLPENWKATPQEITATIYSQTTHNVIFSVTPPFHAGLGSYGITLKATHDQQEVTKDATILVSAKEGILPAAFWRYLLLTLFILTLIVVLALAVLRMRQPAPVYRDETVGLLRKIDQEVKGKRRP